MSKPGILRTLPETATLQIRRPACPACGGSVARIHRRLIDRLISMVVLRHRYRCLALGCGWEGNLPPMKKYVI